MTPEKLKLLAEALGYEARLDTIDYSKYKCVYILSEDEFWHGFNPEEDPAQREEVLLWLLGKGWEVRKHGFNYYFSHVSLTTTLQSVRDEDYTTALMMAADKELGNE